MKATIKFFLSLFLSSLCLVPNGAWSQPKAPPIAAPPAVLHIKKSTIYVYIVGDGFKTSKVVLDNWIERSAKGIAAYFGVFPVKKLTVYIYPSAGSGITFAETMPRNGSEIKVYLGTESTEKDLKKSWMLVHEMVHLGFTFTDDSQDWATEGLATYAEPFIRVQMGDQKREEAWADMKGGLAQGLPQPGDKGLNNTRTWGRVYWGGALFYLLADIQIRTQTNYKKGLPDALKQIVLDGGNIESVWTLDDTFSRADKGTGTKVLTTLYKQLANTPAGADLDFLWKGLGVTGTGKSVNLDQHAPLARIRTSIEAGRAQ